MSYATMNFKEDLFVLQQRNHRLDPNGTSAPNTAHASYRDGSHREGAGGDGSHERHHTTTKHGGGHGGGRGGVRGGGGHEGVARVYRFPKGEHKKRVGGNVMRVQRGRHLLERTHDGAGRPLAGDGSGGGSRDGRHIRKEWKDRSDSADRESPPSFPAIHTGHDGYTIQSLHGAKELRTCEQQVTKPDTHSSWNEPHFAAFIFACSLSSQVHLFGFLRIAPHPLTRAFPSKSHLTPQNTTNVGTIQTGQLEASNSRAVKILRMAKSLDEQGSKQTRQVWLSFSFVVCWVDGWISGCTGLNETGRYGCFLIFIRVAHSRCAPTAVIIDGGIA